jgi:FkbM family methyltransferase
VENLNKIFLDCGTNLGQGLLQFIDKKIIDTTFKIHCFEPNPYAFKFVKNRLLDKNYKDYKIIFNEVALWTENCKKNLTIEAFSGEYKCQHTGKNLGYDLKSGGATNIMGNDWNKPHYINYNDLDQTIDINCINFSEYLQNNIQKDNYVICKMDIEGAEYEVLKKLIKENTINLIDELYIEWHSHLLKSYCDTDGLIKEITNRNIKIFNWI